ncbi:hypothetical protein CDL12_18543 [Handroanthus impetiginosus]|uniref:Peptidase C14 caspase domain-containing protein n=1 Tax=Handroanthus impetiginosus TaxID=429701 RepID=A0A2G9GUD6_9LAMI|nr:hypothetical protein CDL12_18543 [Handroanthus impetiginosus]
MDSLVCRHCRQRSFLTPGTKHVRCPGCQRVLSSPELEKKKNEAKMLYHGIRKRFLGSNNIQQSQNRSQIPCIKMLDPPRRGKRAFLCGVTNKKQKFEVKGTAQDVKNMRDLLVEQFHYLTESILILTEEESFRPPTRNNIEYAFQWLMKGIQLTRKKVDGFDETICPVDFQTNGMIFDDYINETIVRPLIPGVTLHAIIDSDHNGTVLDLPCVYNINTGKWDNFSPSSGTCKGTNEGTAICFSACEDYQFAAHTSALSQEKELTGAMTCTFIKAIKEVDINQKITYQGLLESMHQALKQAHKSGGGLFAGLRKAFHGGILQVIFLYAPRFF